LAAILQESAMSVQQSAVLRARGMAELGMMIADF
jgi:hypothetical protein